MPPQNQQPQNMMQQQLSNIWLEYGKPQQTQSANFSAQIDTINAQQMKLREQILQSEKNLSAQHQVIKHNCSRFGV